jgi:co-chaperonin GroES (HSP10)
MESIETRPSKDQLTPTGDWLLVEPVDVSDISEGGILMPTNNSSAQDAYGKVLKTGPGYYQNGKRIAPGVLAGQTIMFRKGRGLEMRFGGDKVLWMTERDLLAIVG